MRTKKIKKSKKENLQETALCEELKEMHSEFMQFIKTLEEPKDNFEIIQAHLQFFTFKFAKMSLRVKELENKISRLESPVMMQMQ